MPLPPTRDYFYQQTDIPFRCFSFCYPGIQVSLIPELTWSLNITPLFRKITADLKKGKHCR